MKKIITAILLIILCVMPVYADNIRDHIDYAGVGRLDSAVDGARLFDPEFDFEERVYKEAKGETDGETGLKLLEKTAQLFFGAFKTGISETAKIMLALFIFSVILRFLPEGKSSEAAFFASYTVIFSIALYIFQKGAAIASETIEKINFFVKAAVPVMCTLSVPSGMFASSVGTAAIVGGICVVTEAAARILMPLTSMMAALTAANNLSAEVSLKGLEGLIRKLIMWSVGIVTTVFVSLIKIRGITGASFDNVTGKTIKFAVGNMVPVVGGIISDSLENIMSYSRAVQGSCGAVGIIALLYITIPPVMSIGGMLAAFKLTGVVTSTVADGRINGAIDGFADILGIVLIITVVVCILFITAMGSLAA